MRAAFARGGFDEQRPAGTTHSSGRWARCPDGRYRLAVTAAAGTRSVTKTADVIVDRTLTGVVASARAISPNGDGVADGLSLSFSLTQNVPARVDVEQSGAVIATLFQGQPGLGEHTLDWDGTVNGARFPTARTPSWSRSAMRSATSSCPSR